MIERIILIGYRAVGKTTVGYELARKLGWRFFDTDRAVEEQQRISIAKIIAEMGWAQFRQYEKDVISRLRMEKDVVVSTGGGAVLHRKEMASLKGGAIFIWLTAEVGEIRRRIETGNTGSIQRPSLTGSSSSEEIEKVLSERIPIYRELADIEIDTAGCGVDEIADQVLSFLDMQRRGNGGK